MRQYLQIFFETNRTYKVNVILASLTLFFVIWFSTGTLSPYALSAPDDLVISQFTRFNREGINDMVIPGGREALECRYIANIDHGHFLATFLMLDGTDKNLWGGSVVLRRILYPILAYPFMKLMGFETGGIVANFFIYLITFLVFVGFIRHEIGERGAIFTAWAVATFPGVAYFGGLPYSYSIIIPSCLISVMLLWKLEDSSNKKDIFLLSFLLGIVFLGYDLLPIFGFAAIFILLRKKIFIGSGISILGMLLPTVIFSFILKYYYESNLTNTNNEMYKIIMFSYLGIFQGWFSSIGIDPNSSTGIFLSENSPFPDLNRWYQYIKDFPVFLLFNYLFSTFAYLSLVFGLVNIPKLFGKRLKFNSIEIGVLLAIFLIFAFNNLAPPYRSWQFREYGFARIYEPMFIVLVLYLCRKVQLIDSLSQITQRFLIGILTLMIFGNLVTCFSTMIPNNLGLGIYGNFYLQGDTTKKTYSDFKERIRKYGRYPIGFCGSPKNINPK